MSKKPITSKSKKSKNNNQNNSNPDESDHKYDYKSDILYDVENINDIKDLILSHCRAINDEILPLNLYIKLLSSEVSVYFYAFFK